MKLTIFLGAVLLSLSLVACGGAPKPGGGGGNPENGPVISSFKAENTSVALGDSTTLTWDVTGATSLKITSDPVSGVGTVALTDTSLTVTPTQKTVYTLTASNENGNSTEKTTVTVDQIPTQSIAELVKTDPQFSMLVEVLVKTGLNTTLAGDGPYTLFAPNDAAFAFLLDTTLNISFKDFLEQPNLENRFRYHILTSRVLARELEESKAFPTLQGYPVTTEVSEDGDLRVEAATIIETDILATNGVIHIIDEVLLPPVFASVKYTLDATSAENTNISGTVTFFERPNNQTEVVLELTGNTTGKPLSAHIHAGDIGGNGAIEYNLESVTGTPGKSTTTLAVSYAELLAFDGYLDVHLPDELGGVVVANGEIGAGAVSPEPDRRVKAAR